MIHSCAWQLAQTKLVALIVQGFSFKKVTETNLGGL